MSHTKKYFIAFGLVALVGIALYVFVHHGLECFAGGGGSEYTPPKIVEFGKPIELTLELNSWAAPDCNTTPISKVYTDVKCHYRLSGMPEFQTLAMPLTSESKNRAFFKCTVPAVQKGQHADGKIEYFFDFKMGTVTNRRDEKPMLLR